MCACAHPQSQAPPLWLFHSVVLVVLVVLTGFLLPQQETNTQVMVEIPEI